MGISALTGILLAGLTIPTSVRPASDTVPGVAALERALARYSAIAAQGGWPELAGTVRLVPGDASASVHVLRERLAAEGYRPGGSGPDPSRYDSTLVAAVQRFQELHGLEGDGIVGPATIAALNIPAEERARTIEVNLARRAAGPSFTAAREIVVNIPAFTLEVLEAGQPVLSLRTVVGRPDWPTPVLGSEITELVFRPVWTVPPSIAGQEIIPRARKDPGYFERVGMRVFGDSAGIAIEVDPGTVDWNRVTPERLRYRFVQEPGLPNPLGGVKFVFRNPFGVYLHDTPERRLFNRPRRTFSHGCVRIEQADRLVGVLLPDWPRDSIRAAMTSGRDRRVRLAQPVPLHLVYWTTWVEPDGLVAFREDIYRWDGSVSVTDPVPLPPASNLPCTRS